MFYSMTGQGSAVVSADGLTISAEVRSVNSRYLEPSIRVNAFLSGFESKFAELIRKYASRGKVMLNVNIVNSTTDIWNIEIDEALLDLYTSVIQRIDSRLQFEKTSVSLERFLQMSELLKKTPNPEYQNKALILALNSTEKALLNLKESRYVEGSALQKDLKKRVNSLCKITELIGKLEEETQKARHEKIRVQISKIIEDVEIDEKRLLQEVAHLAVRADVTEEITRLKAHTDRMLKLFRSRKPVGSQFNFILQECHREINTIGSKTDNTKVSQLVIDFKEEVERIREQIQNIE